MRERGYTSSALPQPLSHNDDAFRMRITAEISCPKHGSRPQ
jgi:hypothetical protein